MNTLLFIFCGAGIIILICSIKSFRMLNFIVSALSGLAALLAADFAGSFFGLTMELNFFSAATGILGGLPGVILLFVLKILFK